MGDGLETGRSWGSAEERAAVLPELAEAGALVAGTPLRLCYLVAAQSLTGRLTLDEAGGCRHELHFKRGVVERAATTLPDLSLFAWLRSRGILSHSDAARAEEALPRCGGDAAGALLMLGLIPPADAFTHLGGHGRVVFDRALSCTKGRYRWEPAIAPPPGSFPLGEKWLLLCDAGRRLPLEEVGRRLGDRIDCPVMRAGDGLVPVDRLGLNAHELRAVGGFDGTRSLAMLAAAAPTEASVIYRTGLFLAELGLASFAKATLPRPATAPLPAEPSRGERSRGERSAAAGEASNRAGNGAMPAGGRIGARPTHTPGPAGQQRTPGPGAQSRTPGPAGRRSQRSTFTPGPQRAAVPSRYPTDLAGLRDFLSGLEGKNHFEVLGLPRAATPNLIKQAFFQRARAFHPDLAGSGGAEVRQVREAITARLNEAWACLSDPGARSAYVAELDAGGDGSKVDVGSVLIAEQLFQQATVMVKARRFAEALGELDRAIAINPEEGEFYAWRGFARFSAALDKRLARAEAMAEIQHAVDLNPRCAPAFLFAARIATVLGDAEDAIKYYRRCLAVDETNLEAQRELRLLESRMSK